MCRSTVMYCYKEKGIYWHFCPSPHVVRMYKADADVLEVKVQETEESDGCYWGWWSNEMGCFLHVYDAKRKVEICFPYGTKAEEKRGRGRLLPVRVSEIESETKI